MSRPVRTLLAVATSVVATAGLAVAAGAPAQAATTQAPCSQSTNGVVTCVGIQTTGGDVRGYVRAQAPSGKRVSVVRVELQRRACGGSWASWTIRTGPDDGGASDALATTWVTRPGGHQFRTRSRVVVTNRGSNTAHGVDRTSRAFGAC